MQDFLSDPLFFNQLKWGVIAIVWLALLWAIYRDGVILKNNSEHKDIVLLRILQSRNLQIYVFVSILLLITATSELQSKPHASDAVIADIPQTVKVAIPNEDKKPVPEKQVEKPTASIDESKIALPANSKLLFSNITEFNEENGKQQAYTDWLKERYEAWLITYYYLNKCKKVDVKDYDIIVASLAKELDSIRADKAVALSIISAAQGSYGEMYSHIACDDARINEVKVNYDSNMKEQKEKILPQH